MTVKYRKAQQAYYYFIVLTHGCHSRITEAEVSQL